MLPVREILREYLGERSVSNLSLDIESMQKAEKDNLKQIVKKELRSALSNNTSKNIDNLSLYDKYSVYTLDNFGNDTSSITLDEPKVNISIEKDTKKTKNVIKLI